MLLWGLNCGEAERERVAMEIGVEGVGSMMVSESLREREEEEDV